MNYDRNKPLAFIHIPKTAGSSLKEVLTQWFSDGLRSVYFNEKENRPPEKIELKDTAGRFLPDLCVIGHFNRSRNMGIEQCCPEIDQYVTFLRDPFEAHLSNYFYVRTLAKENRAFRNGKVHPIIEKNMSLRDFLENYKKSFFLDFLPAEIDENNFRDVLQEKFIFIGLVETYNESLIQMAKILEKRIDEFVHINKSERRESIADIEGYRQEFYRNNALVKSIYDFVKEKMECKWRNAG